MAAHGSKMATSPAPPSALRTAEKPDRRWRLIAVGAPCLLAAAVFCFHLGRYGLWEADEARYAEIAREMLAGAGYIVPHLNYVAYVEKPPLLYWLTMACMWLLGPTQLAARIVPATAALIGVVATLYFGCRVFDRRRGILAAAILTTCPLYAVMAQLLTTDMLLSVLVAIAFFALFLQWREGGRWWIVLYLASALAVLTKGPIGAVLPALAGAIFLLVRDRPFFRALRKFHLLPGIALLLAIAVPWFIIVALREPGYLHFYIIDEHFKRFFSPNYSHYEPIYFYVPVLAVGILPWIVCAPLLFVYGSSGPARTYCGIAAATVLILFSLADAKLIPYILPAIAPIALLFADSIISAVEQNFSHRWRLRLGSSGTLIACGALPAAGGLGVIVFAFAVRHAHNPYLPLLFGTLVGIGALLLVVGIATTALFRRESYMAGLAVLTVGVAGAIMGGTYGRIAVEPVRPYSALCREIAARAPDATPICYHRYIQALPFYTHHRVILVGKDLTELRFGAERSPERDRYFLSTDRQLMKLWKDNPQALLVIDSPQLARLKARLGPYRVIASEGPKRAIMKASSKGRGT